MADIGEITGLLRAADSGSREAEERLFVLVENDLRAIARKRKRAGPHVEDMCTTMLVHDAFLQLVGRNVTTWEVGDRRKFFGFVARKMHDMLIQTARRERAAKRGPERQEPEDVDALADDSAVHASAAALLDLKAALAKFESFALDDAILFRIRYFLGCTFAEIAELCNVSPTAAKEAWNRSRAWLRRELRGYQPDA